MNPVDLSKPLDIESFPNLTKTQRAMLERYNELTKTPDGRVELAAILENAQKRHREQIAALPNRAARRAALSARRRGR